MTVLPAQRSLFDLPDGVTYLNCANMSPQLRAVTAGGVEAVRRKREPWRRDAADWFTGAEELRSAAARLMGADPNGVALVPAVSYGVAIAAANVPVAPGQNIVVLGEQFPSNVYAWRERAARKGPLCTVIRRIRGGRPVGTHRPGRRAGYELEVSAPDGTLIRRIGREVEFVPSPGWLADTTEARIEAFIGELGGAEAEDYDLPEHLTAFTRILVDDLGHLWVGRTETGRPLVRLANSGV